MTSEEYNKFNYKGFDVSIEIELNQDGTQSDCFNFVISKDGKEIHYDNFYDGLGVVTKEAKKWIENNCPVS